MARRRALSSGAGDESATPLWEDTQQLQSSLSALHRAIELMRSSSERHPLIARTLYDMSTSLPHDNSAFEGFCVVYGTKLLVEAARLYEVCDLLRHSGRLE